MNQRRMDGEYLWLPVRSGAPLRRCAAFCGDTKAFEFTLAADDGGDGPRHTACLPVGVYRGKTLRFEGVTAEWTASLRCACTPPAAPVCSRPRLHFTPPAGWINDPNGLVFHEGRYHLFFQYNPFGTDWGNMTWGHALSDDLFHWRWADPALLPDETGVMYSGSALVDEENAAGYGAGRALFYYTAAGGENEWSRGRPFEQRLAVLEDGGLRLRKTGRVMVPSLTQGNRDPKVIRHLPSGGYVMALYLNGNEFALLRSENLTDWTETQRLILDGMWECPDLIEIPVEGGGTGWIFWSADGYYMAGAFDGYRFTPTGERRCAYAGGEPTAPGGGAVIPGVTLMPYAAQTYAGLTDRVVSVAWLRTSNRPDAAGERLPYTGMMSLPVELTLGGDGRLRLRPARELAALRGERRALSDGDAVLAESAFELGLSLRGGRAALQFPSGRLEVDGETGECRFHSVTGVRRFRLERAETLALRVIVDVGVTEIFSGDGLTYAACDTAPVLAGPVGCRIDGDGEAAFTPLKERRV